MLLAIVALHGERGIARDRLLALLWPESTTERARGALKQTVFTLRRDLGIDDLLLGTAELRLNPLRITVDLHQMREAVAEDRLIDAIDLWSGPFLDGVYLEDQSEELERWIQDVRNETGAEYRQLLRRLAESEEREGRAAGAAGWWRKLSSADPLNSGVIQNLMRTAAGSGDLAGALEAGREYQTRLTEETTGQKDPEVAALLARLIAQRTPALSALGSTSVSPTIDPDPTHRTVRPHPEHSTRRRLLVGALLAIAVVGTAALALTRPRPRRFAPSHPARVAVLPLANLTGDSTLTPIGWMAGDWITRGLMEFDLLRVVDLPRLRLQGGEPGGGDPAAAAVKNGADFLIRGRFYRVTDSLEYAIELVDARTGLALRTVPMLRFKQEEYRPGLGALRDKVAVVVAATLDTRYTPITDPHDNPPSLAAYREFMAGQSFFWSFQAESAATKFLSALAGDSTYLTPLPWLATVYRGGDRCNLTDRLVREYGVRLADMSAFDRLILDRQLALCAGDKASTVRLARESVRRYPGSPFSWYILGVYANDSDRNREALDALAHLDPDYDLGFDQTPGHQSWFMNKSMAQHRLGDFTGELRTARQFESRRGPTTFSRILLTRALAALGRDSEVEALAEGLPEVSIDSSDMPYERYAPALILQAGSELAAHGSIDAARRVWETALRKTESILLPRHTDNYTRLTRVMALDLTGRSREALSAVLQLEREVGADWLIKAERGVVLGHLGDTLQALEIARDLPDTVSASCEGGAFFQQARVLAAAGSKDGAVKALKQGIERPLRLCWSVRYLAHMEPEFLRLVGYPPFDSLVRPQDAPVSPSR